MESILSRPQCVTWYTSSHNFLTSSYIFLGFGNVDTRRFRRMVAMEPALMLEKAENTLCELPPPINMLARS